MFSNNGDCMKRRKFLHSTLATFAGAFVAKSIKPASPPEIPAKREPTITIKLDVRSNDSHVVEVVKRNYSDNAR